MKQEDSQRTKSKEGITDQMEGNGRKCEERSIDRKPDISCEVPCGYIITKNTDRYRMIERKRMKKSNKKTFKLPKTKCQLWCAAKWARVIKYMKTTIYSLQIDYEDMEMNTAELFILLEELLSTPPATDSRENFAEEEKNEVLEMRMDQEAEKEGQLINFTNEAFDDPSRR